MKRITEKLKRNDKVPKDLPLEKGNSLLSSMGALGRDFFSQIYDLGCDEHGNFGHSSMTRARKAFSMPSNPTSSISASGRRKSRAGSVNRTIRSRSIPVTAPCGRSRSCRIASWRCSRLIRSSSLGYPRHDA